MTNLRSGGQVILLLGWMFSLASLASVTQPCAELAADPFDPQNETGFGVFDYDVDVAAARAANSREFKETEVYRDERVFAHNDRVERERIEQEDRRSRYERSRDRYRQADRTARHNEVMRKFRDICRTLDSAISPNYKPITVDGC